MKPARCPNCGSSQFLRVGPDRWECAYCGSQFIEEQEVAAPPEPPPVYRAPVYRMRMSLTAWSIIATVLGSSFVPVLGAALGLYLGYRALAKARAGGQEQESLAKVAIVLGWIFLAAGVLSLCLWGGTWAWGLCASLTESLFNY